MGVKLPPMPPFLEHWKKNGFLRHLRITLLEYYQAHKLRRFYVRVILGFSLLFAALLFNAAANWYTARFDNLPASLPGDIILDHIPVINVDLVFFWGIVVFIALVVALGLKRPARIPFLLESAALFIGIRAFFVVLTHVSAPIDRSAVPLETFFQRLIAGSGNDLFFSGHTGFPFLMALLFWREAYLRNVFLSMSLTYGTVVLLGHLHYSIDVFSAFFITYGILHIARFLFPEDAEAFGKTV